METPIKLIAIVGGSGAGKSWLVRQLGAEFGPEATTLALDDFYRDLSHLDPAARARVNFDYPEAIDWLLFEEVLRALRDGLPTVVPRYDFTTHTRTVFGEYRSARPIVLVEGLWLLWPEKIRQMFDLKVFLDCAETVRWERRLARDLHERGRTAASIHDQFWKVVAPMHERFVEAQKVWADEIFQQPMTADDCKKLAATIQRTGTPLATLPEPAVAATNVL